MSGIGGFSGFGIPTALVPLFSIALREPGASKDAPVSGSAPSREAAASEEGLTRAAVLPLLLALPEYQTLLIYFMI